jgi:kynurenine formamidase
MKYIDLSRTVTPELSVWPGDPFRLERIEKNGFVVDNILTSSMHVGTHVDAPVHMIAGGKSLAQYGPEKFIGKGVLIDARGRKVIDTDLLNYINIERDDIVFILTDSDQKFGTAEYFESYPTFTTGFANELVKLGVKMVGMDSPSPDVEPFDVHKILLGADILIIEMMTNLDKLLGVSSFDVIALPPKFDTAGSFIRVIVRI